MYQSTETLAPAGTLQAPSPDVRYPAKLDPFSSHAVIAGQVQALARRHASSGRPPPLVVDAGCGSGPLGLLLRGVPVRTVGIDSDAHGLAAAARTGYAVVAGDLGGPALPPLRRPADALVCADVLEHFPDPGTQLDNLLRTYLRPGGAVIVSLPNVAHGYVRAQLLRGRWDYADRGILDRTHLRFFTGETARRMLVTAGVAIERVEVTPLPLPVVHPAFGRGRSLYWAHAASAALTRLWPSLLAYQYVFAGTWRP